MYPQLSDMIKDLTGFYIPLPVQTFGFFLALAFVVAALVVYKEFKRYENAGILQGTKETIIVGKGAGFGELLFNGILGFALGFKGVLAVSNWAAFSKKPQDFITSGEGSWIGGIILALIAAGYTYYVKNKEKLDKPVEKTITVLPSYRVGDFIILAAISGILGAKIFTWIEDIPAFLADPIGAIMSFSGLAFYGGLITAAVVLLYYGKKKKIPPLRLADITAPALIIAYAVGRLGCHFSGDGDWGIENLRAKPLSFLPDWAWAYTYPNNVIEKGVQIPGCVGDYCFQLPNPVWPTSVYEFVFGTIIFFILWGLRKKLMLIPGLLFCLYLILNGIERGTIETIRVNDRYDWFFNFSQAQMIALGFILSGLIFGAYLIIQHKNKNTLSNG